MESPEAHLAMEPDCSMTEFQSPTGLLENITTNVFVSSRSIDVLTSIQPNFQLRPDNEIMLKLRAIRAQGDRSALIAVR